jgi:hypothetical protein
MADSCEKGQLEMGPDCAGCSAYCIFERIIDLTQMGSGTRPPVPLELNRPDGDEQE